MSISIVPARGDVYWVNFGNSNGTSKTGIRPAVILQNDKGNQHSPNTVVVPVTSRIPEKVYPGVVIPTGIAGLQKQSYADCTQIQTIDKIMLGMRIGELPILYLDRIATEVARNLALVNRIHREMDTQQTPSEQHICSHPTTRKERINGAHTGDYICTLCGKTLTPEEAGRR